MDVWAVARRRCRRRAASVAVVLALLAVSAACSERERPGAAPGAVTGTTPAAGAAVGDGEPVLAPFVGRPWFDGRVPAPSRASAAETPLPVGFLNVDAGPVGAMPELHAATDAAVQLVNRELGGVGGRPVRLVPCLLSNPLSAEESQACARRFVERRVVAVLGGIGLANGPALQVLEENRIPYVGGIPVNTDEMTSAVSFQFSGGSPGAFAAFAQQAVAVEGARRVAVLYAEYPAVRTAAVDYGAAVARALGARVTEVSFPMVSQDYVAPVQKAMESSPDAMFVGAADLACAPIMQAIADLGRPVTVYLVGACADARQVDKVGVERLRGFRFNVENRLDQTVDDSVDTEVYRAAMAAFAPRTSPASAATVAFRGAMDLWALLDELGPEASASALIRELRAAVDRPSFDGHPFTCDGTPVPDLPSLCAPQEVIVRLTADGGFREVSDGWIDVPAVLRRVGIGGSTGGGADERGGQGADR